jgi:hypothetical protein
MRRGRNVVRRLEWTMLNLRHSYRQSQVVIPLTADWRARRLQRLEVFQSPDQWIFAWCAFTQAFINISRSGRKNKQKLLGRSQRRRLWTLRRKAAPPSAGWQSRMKQPPLQQHSLGVHLCGNLKLHLPMDLLTFTTHLPISRNI